MTTNRLFRFYLFGTPRLYAGPTLIPLRPQPAALCAYLIMNRERPITREEIQSVFWPEAEPARAQERLRRTLYLLRQAIQPYPCFVCGDGSELAISPDADLWVDYEEFTALLDDAQRHGAARRAALQQAVLLYKDDLLKNVYMDWSGVESEHARQRFLTALRQVIADCQQECEWDDVIRYSHLLLRYDPLQEAAYRALMIAYSATGDRSAAIRQYQQCSRVLGDELGVEPMPETTQLFERIRQGIGVSMPKLSTQVLLAVSGPGFQRAYTAGRAHA